jgi:hypothetical protein
MLRPLDWSESLARLANLILAVGGATFALAACASIERAADNVRSLANHQPENVSYPDIADIPDKPARPETAAQHNATIEELRSDRDALTADAQTLRDQAAAMPPPPPPAGQKPARAQSRPGQ